MAIDFPVVNSDPSLPWLNPDTGITYIYKDGAWRVLSSTDFEDLEDIYVNISGDTMTGQLTLPGGGTGAQAIQVQEVETLIGTIDSTDYVSKTDTNSQNIVSDLTLGTDKITLNADGRASSQQLTVGAAPPAEFANSPGLTKSDWFLSVENETILDAPVSYTLFRGDDRNNNTVFGVYANGSASLASGAVSITNNGQITVQRLDDRDDYSSYVVRDSDGNVTFSVKGNGSIDIGTASAGSDYGIFAKVNRDKTGSATSAAITARNYAVGGLNFRGQNTTSGTTTCQIYENGSAEFADNVNIGPRNVSSATSEGIVLTKYGFIGSQFLGGASGTQVALRFTEGISPAGDFFKVQVNGDGYFKGSVTATNTFFSLEPDNNDNYTITTEEYEEQEELTPYVPAVPATYDEYGNELTAEVPEVEATYQTVTKTRDIRTYTGPTLDVKERLQNLIARLDAIEANEVVDDATDNSLLLAVAELTSRLNERDALITTLTTRIEALENA